MKNQYWYSKAAWDYENHRSTKTCHREVLVNGEWKRFTCHTDQPISTYDWDDAVLVAESNTKLPIRINGILQGQYR